MTDTKLTATEALDEAYDRATQQQSSLNYYGNVPPSGAELLVELRALGFEVEPALRQAVPSIPADHLAACAHWLEMEAHSSARNAEELASADVLVAWLRALHDAS